METHEDAKQNQLTPFEQAIIRIDQRSDERLARVDERLERIVTLLATSIERNVGPQPPRSFSKEESGKKKVGGEKVGDEKIGGDEGGGDESVISKQSAQAVTLLNQTVTGVPQPVAQPLPLAPQPVVESPKPAVAVAKKTNRDNFITVVGVVCVLLGLLSSIIAYNISKTSPASSDRKGMNAVLSSEITRLVNLEILYKNYRVYTDYMLNNTLRQQLQTYLPKAPEAERPELVKQVAQAAEVVAIGPMFFPLRYLNRDGTYSKERQLGETWAQAAQKLDLNPEPHFKKADKLRVSSLNLSWLLLTAIVALSLFNIATLIHKERPVIRYVLAVTGLICGLISLVGLIQEVWV